MEHSTALSGEKLKEYNRDKLGMWLFLASEIMFFSGFIASYIVLRMSNSEIAMHSQNLLSWQLAAVNTMVLICSSLTMALAVYFVQNGDRRKTSVFLLLTILFGLAFLGIKYKEYTHKFEHRLTSEEITHILPATTAKYVQEQKQNLKDAQEAKDEESIKKFEGEIDKYTDGIFPHTNIFFASYFTMTGFHGLHVLIGILVLAYLLFRNIAGAYSSENFTSVEITGLYWHFVDIVWMFLFAILYLT